MVCRTVKLQHKALCCHSSLEIATSLFFLSTSEKTLDQALNVLARALEANRGCSKLWAHYLDLYSRRDCGEEAQDLRQLCDQAVHYAANYDLWWKVGHFSLCE